MGGETRDRILEVAARLFEERGFEATTVAAILRGAGVNSGSLYHFFPSKGALLSGVLERYVETLAPTVLEPTESTTSDAIQRVFALLEVYRRRLLVSDCRRGSPVGDLALEVGSRDPQAGALIQSYFRAWVEGVRDWLETAGERLPSDLDREALAWNVLAVAEGAVMQARAAGSLLPYDAAVGQLRSHFGLLEQVARRGRAAAEATEPAEPPTQEREVEQEAKAADPSGWRAW